MGLAQGLGELGQLCTAEQDKNNDEHDDEFGGTEVHIATVSSNHRSLHVTGHDSLVIECVVNISEGQNKALIDQIAASAGRDLLDLHTDAHHNRSVLTLVGVDAPRRVTAKAVELLDIRSHSGVHPRIGVVDVVPFVALSGSTKQDARIARDEFCQWAGEELAVPCFTYGDHRSLPDIRKQAWNTLTPDCGPPNPHPSAGAIAVGERDLLVAYNLWLETPDLALAKEIAKQIRTSELRTLGLQVGNEVQVSMNLISPLSSGPGRAYDLVSERASINRAELVGLVPEAVLHREDPSRWGQLDLSVGQTIESRLLGRS